MIAVPLTQKTLGVTIAAPVSRLHIRMAFEMLRGMADRRGARLTEGRRTRNKDGSRSVDFIVVQRKI